MNVTQTLEQEVSDLIAGNDLYRTLNGEWKYLLESYLGGKDYRDAGHLTRYQLETNAEYSARLAATPLDNHCQSVVSVYNSFLFRNDPDRDFGPLTNNPDIEDFLKDADFDGRSLNSFMKDVATWSSVFGHAWIVMVKPNVGAITRADEIAVGARPYVNLLTPMTVLDWTWERSPSGRYSLSYFKYVEDVNGDVRTIKEWTPDTIRTAIVDSKNNKFISDIVEVNGLGKIPAICAYNGRSTVRGIGVSDIADIADAQRFIYNAKSEIFQSIQLDSHPSLVKTPETQAGIGAGSIIHMPENMDPGLKPYLLEFSGASVDAILTAIKDTVDSIDKMANTGSIRSTEAARMSGVAQQQEFELLNARLSEKADNLELAEEQMWRLWCEYQAVPYSIEVEYPGSFNIRDTDAEIKQLQIAASTNPADPRVKAAIDMKLLDWLDLDEDELAAIGDSRIVKPDTIPEEDDYYVFEPHVMVDPVTGEERTVTTQEEHVVLANQGWYHKQ